MQYWGVTLRKGHRNLWLLFLLYSHIFSYFQLLICSQTFLNLKYIQTLEISYEFDVRLIFTPMCGGRICHVLLTVQKTHRRSLLFIDNRHFIGFLDKQSLAASTEINLLSLIHICIGP